MKLLIKRVALVFGAATLAACTPGPAPANNKCAQLMPGDLVITEFMKNPVGTDAGKEWFEIHNPGSDPVDLQGIDLALSKADGSGEKRHRVISVTVPAGGYLTLGDAEAVAGSDPDAGATLPSWLDYSYGKSLGAMANTTGRIALKCGTVLLDEVVYADGGREGHSHELNGAVAPDATGNDEAESWCTTSASAYDDEGTHFGTPGAANGVCGGAPGGQCRDLVSGQLRAPVVPGPGDLVITEIMANPNAVLDASGEWFEVYAPNRAVDLNGLKVGSADADGALLGGSESCLTVGAGGYAVLARKSDPAANGGLNNVLATFSRSLTNAGGTLALRAGDTIVDVATYGSDRPGKSHQLSSGLLDAASNDSADNFCPAISPMANGDFGTPGAPNVACPIPLPNGQCKIPGTDTARAIVNPVVGDLVINEYMADPTAVVDTQGEWFEVYVQRNVDLNGVQIGAAATGIIQGADCVEVQAGDYLVFARSDDPEANGGLPGVFRTTSLSLGNSSGSIVISLNGNTLDEVSWSSAVPAGRSSQVKPAHRSVTGNDVAANYCPGTTAYGDGDSGTPGAANVCGP